jgi:7,8-dihydropterin-6-yl-methyl-4-(beta-D-ribofuranosyl)aminobenzene 5'-phosphate synthase
MQKPPIHLKEVDRVEILVLIDNYVNVLIGGNEVVTRPALAKDGKIPSDTFLAEHGLSLLITVFRGEEQHTILFDAGYTNVGVLYNLERLEVDTDRIEAIVVSHGHMDHTGVLYSILDRIPGRVPLVVHPHVFFSPRYQKTDDGTKNLFPKTIERSKLEEHGAEIMEKETPTTLADHSILVTGEVERVTSFEKGFPNAFMERKGRLEKDTIADDQAIAAVLHGNRLVVISGCAHSGIINTILYCKKLTGIENVHTVIGGFHLTGPVFEPIIDDTILELKKMSPEVIVPMHCTGWEATQRFSHEFPTSFILNSVGSKYTLS